MTREEALSEKIREIQTTLSVWVKTSGYFGVGDSVLLTASIQTSPVVVIGDNENVKTEIYKLKTSPFYRFLTNQIPPDDWPAIINAVPDDLRNITEIFRKNGNTPTDDRQFMLDKMFPSDRLDRSFRKNGLRYRVCCIGRLSTPQTATDSYKHVAHLWQLWKVEPKKSVLKHWK